MNKNKLLGNLVILLIGFIFLFKVSSRLIPRLAIFISSRDCTATVERFENEGPEYFLTYSFQNLESGHTYVVKKEIPSGRIDQIKGKNKILISYNELFPEYTIIKELTDHFYLIQIFAIIAISIAIGKSILDIKDSIMSSKP